VGVFCELVDARESCYKKSGISAGNFMKAIQGYHFIKPEDLLWRPSNLMKIPNADYLERTGSHNLGARLWRLPPKSANTLHKHIRAEEFILCWKAWVACAWETKR
jgi:hypothetical protein